MANIDITLAERGKRYGAFIDHATLTKQLKDIIWAGVEKYQSETLSADQYEALDMIAHKIGRIVCGDPHYADSWIDIAGYAKLVANRLEEEATHDVVVEQRSGNISLGHGHVVRASSPAVPVLEKVSFNASPDNPQSFQWSPTRPLIST